MKTVLILVTIANRDKEDTFMWVASEHIVNIRQGASGCHLLTSAGVDYELRDYACDVVAKLTEATLNVAGPQAALAVTGQ